MLAHVHTIEVDDETPVRGAARGVVEVGLSIRKHRGWTRWSVADGVCEVAGVNDGVAEGEDTLEAAARP